MITDGGPHSTEKWAEATASHIVQIAEHVAGTHRASAVKLEAAIIDILEGHHTTVQSGERAKIAEHGHARLLHDNDPEHHLSLEEAVADIINAAAGTPWEDDFLGMGLDLMHLLASHFKTNIHIERAYHADRNHHTDEAAQFRAKNNVGSHDHIKGGK
jgi:hypothetical protein